MGVKGMKVTKIIVEGEANLASKVGAKIAIVVGFCSSKTTYNYLGMYSWNEGSAPSFTKISGTSSNPASNEQGTIQFSPGSEGYSINRWWIISLNE